MNGVRQFVSPSEQDELQNNYTLRLVPKPNYINVLCILNQLIVKQMLGLRRVEIRGAFNREDKLKLQEFLA